MVPICALKLKFIVSLSKLNAVTDKSWTSIFTLTLQLADWVPQVAVITQLPFDTGVTTPLFTVHIPVGDTLHTTESDVLEGVNVAVNVWAVVECSNTKLLVFKVIPVHGTDGAGGVNEFI